MFTSVEIPHLQTGQKIVDYQKIFLAATATLKDDQRRACLPIYVDRTEGEKQIAFAASAEESLEKAFKFLEDYIDGPPCLYTESAKFFDMKPKDTRSMDSIRSYYFELLEVTFRADMSGDAFLKRFFTNIQGGKRLLEEVKDELKHEMSKTVLMELFKKIMPKISKKLPGNETLDTAKEEQFVFPIDRGTDSSENPPTWAVNLQNNFNELRLRVESNESGYGEEDDNQVFAYERRPNKDNKKKSGCYTCGKMGHNQKQCFKRICTKC